MTDHYRKNMRDAAEAEKALFLAGADKQPRKEAPGKGATADKDYDLTNNNKKGPDKGDRFLFIQICDYVLINTVVLVNVVAFWRGLFGILAQFSGYYPLLLVFLLGSLIHFQFTASRSVYKKYLKKKSICSSILRKAYTYVFGSACVMQWAGLWYILDEMTGMETYPPLAYTVVCTALLVGLRLYRNVLAPPFLFLTDRLDQFFDVQTVFKTTLSDKGSSDTSLYVLDSFFSVFVIGSLVVVVWRGVWCLTDIFLYPENEAFSSFCSLVIGYVLAVVVFGLQIPVENLTEKLKGFWKLAVIDIYVFISFIGTINLWRGIWNLLNIYFLPEDPVLSCWLCHLGSFAILVLMNCSNSVLVRGVYLDGEGDKCGVLPMSYLRLIFEDRLRKKAEKSQGNHKIDASVKIRAEDVEKGEKENPECLKDPVQNSVSVEVKS